MSKFCKTKEFTIFYSSLSSPRLRLYILVIIMADNAPKISGHDYVNILKKEEFMQGNGRKILRLILFRRWSYY